MLQDNMQPSPNPLAMIHPHASLASQPYFPRVSMRVWKVGGGKGRKISIARSILDPKRQLRMRSEQVLM